MELVIREFALADKEECTEAFKSNVPDYFTEDEISDFERFLDNYSVRFTEINTLRRTYYYTVLLQNKIIGCGGFGDKENNEVISLAWGLIHKHYHKKGLGEKLLLFRLEKLKNLSASSQVVIDTTQHTYTFFEKFGFVTTKITKNFYTKGMHRYDMILNTKN
jgi:predicted GNAT family N-acyltransferase